MALPPVALLLLVWSLDWVLVLLPPVAEVSPVVCLAALELSEELFEELSTVSEIGVPLPVPVPLPEPSLMT